MKRSTTVRMRRRIAVGKAASEKVAKSEQLNFRIEETKIHELQQLAYSKGLPVSTMVYDWVLERLALEKFGEAEVTGKSLQLLSEIHGKLHNFFDAPKPQSKGSIKVAEGASTYDARKNRLKKL